MTKKKGLKLSEYFKELKVGDKVALVRNRSFRPGFPKHFNGLNGVIIKKSRNLYKVKFLNGKVYKYLEIKPVYLKKIK